MTGVNYICVSEEDGSKSIEVPLEANGTLLLGTLTAQFPSCTGLKFRSEETGAYRGVRLYEGSLFPPETGWQKHSYICVYPKGTITEPSNQSEACIPRSITGLELTQPTMTTDLIVLGMAWTTDADSLRNYFTQYGELVMVQVKQDPTTMLSKGYGFLRFAEYDSQVMCLSAGKHYIDGRWCEMEVTPLEVTRKIFVGRITEAISIDRIRHHFSKYGIVLDVYIPKPFRNFAFVTFADPASVTALMQDEHEIGGLMCHVGLATPKAGGVAGRIPMPGYMGGTGMEGLMPAAAVQSTMAAMMGNSNVLAAMMQGRQTNVTTSVRKRSPVGIKKRSSSSTSYSSSSASRSGSRRRSSDQQRKRNRRKSRSRSRRRSRKSRSRSRRKSRSRSRRKSRSRSRRKSRSRSRRKSRGHSRRKSRSRSRRRSRSRSRRGRRDRSRDRRSNRDRSSGRRRTRSGSRKRRGSSRDYSRDGRRDRSRSRSRDRGDRSRDRRDTSSSRRRDGSWSRSRKKQSNDESRDRRSTSGGRSNSKDRRERSRKRSTTSRDRHETNGHRRDTTADPCDTSTDQPETSADRSDASPDRRKTSADRREPSQECRNSSHDDRNEHSRQSEDRTVVVSAENGD